MKDLLGYDSIDELFDSLIERTLAGEAIPFDEWMDVEFTLAEEPDVTPTEADMENARQYREAFLHRLELAGLSVQNRFQLCEELYGKAMKAPSDELLLLYCDLVCDDGLLLDVDRSERTQEQDALCCQRQKRQSKALYGYLSMLRQQSNRFQEIINETVSIPTSGVDDLTAEQSRIVADAYCAAIQPEGDCPKLADNIALLLQIAHKNPGLREIEPLFLYRALTRHARRLQRDNAALCLYGFDRLSNLGELCREMYPAMYPVRFAPQVEDIFLLNPFSCFEHGYGDNVVLQSSGLTAESIQKYTATRSRRKICALERVPGYLNRNIIDLTTRFLESEPQKVPSLCEEILENADLPLAQKPSKRERPLMLAAINQALMDAQDVWAEDYLVRAGKALSGDEKYSCDL